MGKVSADYLSQLFQAVVLPSTSVKLPNSNRTVDILTLRRRERDWKGSTPASFGSVPKKPVLEFDGQPSWAEFILLRLLEADGWEGAWIKNWGGRDFWTEPLVRTSLPPGADTLYRKLAEHAANGGGCWDILVGRGEDVLFIESKQRGRDRLKASQVAWLDNALRHGVPASSFVVVEWWRE